MQVSLGAKATLGEIAHLRDAVLDALTHHDDIELDNASLEDVDLSFVQLVLAARSEATRAGKSLRLSVPAIDSLAALLERGGLLTCVSDEDRAFWFHGDLPQ